MRHPIDISVPRGPETRFCQSELRAEISVSCPRDGKRIYTTPGGLENFFRPGGVGKIFPSRWGWGKTPKDFQRNRLGELAVSFFEILKLLIFSMEFLADAAHHLLEYGKLPDHLPDEEAARVVHFYGC